MASRSTLRNDNRGVKLDTRFGKAEDLRFGSTVEWERKFSVIS